MMYDATDVLTLARTLWGEARGESDDGKTAVAWVVRNRAERAGFAGRLLGQAGAVAHVCRAPWQFSCWNDNDPNRAALEALSLDACPDEAAIARLVLSGSVADPTRGADH